PDTQAGDQAMATLVLRDGAAFDPVDFASWLDSQEDLGPKWRPRYVRLTAEMPTTGTNKIVKRTLAQQKFRRDLIGDDAVYVRERGDTAYRPFTADDEAGVRDGMAVTGRERFWDL
ncbi:MAG: steroid-22-oyl-CoA synthetase, partial [Actinomycetota bacterium]